MFVFLLVLVTITSALGSKDVSCNFGSYSGGLCRWEVDQNSSCQWQQKVKHSKQKGYIYLDGADGCQSYLMWTYGSFDGWSDSYFTMEYSVFGPGPFTLKASTGKSGDIWLCQIQPGNSIKRTARVRVPGSTMYLYILGQVAKGSRIMITQIWGKLRGGKQQKHCPLLPTTWIPTTRLTPTETYQKISKLPTIIRPIRTKVPTTMTTTEMSTERTKLPTRIKPIRTKVPTTMTTTEMSTERTKLPTRIRPIRTKVPTTMTTTEMSAEKPTSKLTNRPTITKMLKKTTIPTLASNMSVSSFSNISTLRWTNGREFTSSTAGIPTEKVKIGKSVDQMINEMTKNVILAVVVGVSASTIIISIIVLIRTRK